MQNHVNVGGWEGRARRQSPGMSSGSEHPYGHFLLCFACSRLSRPAKWGQEALGRRGRLRRTGQVPLNLLRIFPPAPLLALKIIYVCKLLLIHMSYSSCLPTGLGMAEGYRAGGLRNRMAEGALRWKSRASGFGPSSVTAVPLHPLPRAQVAYLQKERVGRPKNSDILCSCDPRRGSDERGTSSFTARDLSMAVPLPLCRRVKASPGPARQEAPDMWRAAGVFPLFVWLHAGP